MHIFIQNLNTKFKFKKSKKVAIGHLKMVVGVFEDTSFKNPANDVFT